MKRLLQRLGILFGVIIGGTFIDWITHSFRVDWHVEPEYFVGKILFGTLWAILGFYILKHVLGVRSMRSFVWGVPAVVALMLQTKYFYQGLDLGFVIFFLFGHYLMFLPFSLLAFRRWRGLFGIESGASGRLHWARFISLMIIVEVGFGLYFLNQYGWLR